MQGMMEVVRGLEGKELDVILHSPGGSAESAEQIIEYLRTMFDYIRAFVPLQAKSAATMMALGCDEIVLGNHSELGPIDPQIFVPVPEGMRLAPAHAIIRDFRRAQEESANDAKALAAWVPILRSYAGGLLEFCTQQVQLSIDIVAGWLERYMLRHEDMKVPEAERKDKARRIAEYFGSERAYDRYRSHSRAIRFPELRDQGVRVRRLEDDRKLQDAVLTVFHATDHSLRGPVAKIVENQLGRRWVRISGVFQVVQQAPPPAAPEKKP